MHYTLLRVAADGRVLLRERHERRVSLQGFVPVPGIHAVRRDEAGVLHSELRPASRLFDGMPSRLRPSPLGPTDASIPKPRPPCVFDAVRVPGVATLLTSPDGREVYEACSAAVVGWDGGFVLVPMDRPRVWSTSEAAIRAGLPFRERPLLVNEGLPLVLVNAVKGPCTLGRESAGFPSEAVREIARLIGVGE